MAPLNCSVNLTTLSGGMNPHLNFSEESVVWQGSFPSDRTLPNHKGSPAEGFVRLANAAVPFFGAGDFSPPEFRPGLWPLEEMAPVSVPETTVDEQHNFSTWHYYVGLAGKIFVVQSVAITPGVQSFSYCELRLGILAPDTGHHLRPLSFVYNIDHKRSVVFEWQDCWLSV